MQGDLFQSKDEECFEDFGESQQSSLRDQSSQLKAHLLSQALQNQKDCVDTCNNEHEFQQLQKENEQMKSQILNLNKVLEAVQIDEDEYLVKKEGHVESLQVQLSLKKK